MKKVLDIISTLKRWKIVFSLTAILILLHLMRHAGIHYHISFYNNCLLYTLEIITILLIIINTGRKHKIIYLYMIIILLTAEIFSRYIYKKDIYEKNFTGIYKSCSASLPGDDIHPDGASATELKYYDYFLFAPFRGNYGRMNITNYYSSRFVPASLNPGKGDITIWTFGGSTMLNIEISDELSIANQLALHLRKAGINPVVVNFGMRGYQSSLESIKFQELLKLVPSKEKPDIVIFYDGFNDAGFTYWFGAGKMSINSSNKLKAIVEGEYMKLFLFSAFNMLNRISKFWEYFIEPSFNSDYSLFGGYSRENVNTNDGNIEAGVQTYNANIAIIQSICKSYRIKPFFILQPMIYTKKVLTGFEKSILHEYVDPSSAREMKLFYSIAKNELKDNPDFYDFTGILNNSNSNDFYDLGHIGPMTGKIIGKAIADTLMEYIDKSYDLKKEIRVK